MRVLIVEDSAVLIPRLISGREEIAGVEME
jgi:hypothetical protein